MRDIRHAVKGRLTSALRSGAAAEGREGAAGGGWAGRSRLTAPGPALPSPALPSLARRGAARRELYGGGDDDDAGGVGDRAGLRGGRGVPRGAQDLLRAQEPAPQEQQFRASWRFQASLKLLQHDLTNPATTASSCVSRMPGGRSVGSSSRSSKQPSSCSSEYPSARHLPSTSASPPACPRHPGAHGGPQGTPVSLPSVQELSLNLLYSIGTRL
ncbi:uncharacterized protein LOC115614839 [Strigops habroptila]|uniref:uncharacterized protein LOC115614839 n=1 Tax=Strigops habroptila TaxID=2489341 RepID=UPI0011CF4943|nr:uncharacterized protein LOC115614839 [Strigops habroptila]